MKWLIKSLRTSALFVGSIVGAGFATGQEVSLFFGSDGVLSVVVASLFMAICAFAFMEIGARGGVSVGVRIATDTLVSLSSFAVYAAMIAAAEEVLSSLTGQDGISLFLAVGVGVFFARGRGNLSLLNLLAVPFMIVIILIVGGRVGGSIVGGFHLLSALAYGGMNLLFSGALMVGEGEESTQRERIAASIMSGAMIFLMLLFMRRCATGGSDMPFLDAADREGVGCAARISLLLAILTTMASCAYLGIDRLRTVTGDTLLSVGLVTLSGVALSAFGFAPIVRTTYPIVSYLGLAATIAALALSLFRLFGGESGGNFWKKFPHQKSPRRIDGGERS